MIQDIYPHQLNNHYDPGVQAKKEDINFFWFRKKLIFASYLFSSLLYIPNRNRYNSR